MADKIKKLSQAIRLGATFRPQCWGSYFALKDGKITESCAIGAAGEALFGESAAQPLLGGAVMERLGLSQNIIRQVVCLNDTGDTREQIADWLEAQGY